MTILSRRPVTFLINSLSNPNELRHLKKMNSSKKSLKFCSPNICRNSSISSSVNGYSSLSTAPFEEEDLIFLDLAGLAKKGPSKKS